MIKKKQISVWKILGKNPTLLGTLLWVLAMPIFLFSNNIKSEDRWIILRTLVVSIVLGYILWRVLI